MEQEMMMGWQWHQLSVWYFASDRSPRCHAGASSLNVHRQPTVSKHWRQISMTRSAQQFSDLCTLLDCCMNVWFVAVTCLQMLVEVLIYLGLWMKCCFDVVACCTASLVRSHSTVTILSVEYCLWYKSPVSCFCTLGSSAEKHPLQVT